MIVSRKLSYIFAETRTCFIVEVSAVLHCDVPLAGHGPDFPGGNEVWDGLVRNGFRKTTAVRLEPEAGPVNVMAWLARFLRPKRV